MLSKMILLGLSAAFVLVMGTAGAEGLRSSATERIHASREAHQKAMNQGKIGKRGFIDPLDPLAAAQSAEPPKPVEPTTPTTPIKPVKPGKSTMVQGCAGVADLDARRACEKALADKKTDKCASITDPVRRKQCQEAAARNKKVPEKKTSQNKKPVEKRSSYDGK